MYVCGPTVYDLSHIGHARSAVAFDVVYRYLKYKGYNVKYTRNYTDIDDKIINRANKDGVSWNEISERYIKAFDEDMVALGVKLPTFRPKATETIQEMLNVIQTLIDKNFAYALNGDVYYSVRKFAGYGKLSGKNIEELEAGARVEVDERKKDPLDFALWKSSKPGEPSWPSPWGEGRPGWHIECSAMSQKFLGDTIDIHGGGKDLIFPHHENEVAQSEAATGKPFVRYWLHNGFVNIEKEKMSKSLGNFFTIKEVLKIYHPEVVRFFLLTTHYRSPIDYSDAALHEAKAGLERFYRVKEFLAEFEDVTFNREPITHLQKETAIKLTELEAKVIAAMDDDFNTALAIGHMFEALTLMNRIYDNFKSGGAEREGVLPVLQQGKRIIEKLGGEMLGLFRADPNEFFRYGTTLIISTEEIERRIEDRNYAKKKKDFKTADDIRSELDKKGVLLEDTPKGTVWRIKAA